VRRAESGRGGGRLARPLGPRHAGRGAPVMREGRFEGGASGRDRAVSRRGRLSGRTQDSLGARISTKRMRVPGGDWAAAGRAYSGTTPITG
jgi:hypothetical protein